jgi:transcriptional antiterminator NusG
MLAPLFPGYIFITADTVSEETFRLLRGLPGFYRFLESNDRIRALTGRDAEIVAHFVKFGDVIGKSVVTFDQDQRIRVLRGPLEGLEGSIVKIDKRKQRAKVQLDLYDESFLVDFGFDLLGHGIDRPGTDST